MSRQRGYLRILFSSRVLLNLEAADAVYRQAYEQALTRGSETRSARGEAVAAYSDFVACRGAYADGPYDPDVQGRRFAKGPLYDFALALSRLNRESGEDLVEIGLSAKDEAESGITIFRNLDVTELGDHLGYRLLTCGNPVIQSFHDSFGTDLFLSRNSQDVQHARDHGVASALIHFPDGWEYDHSERSGPLKIMVDGDGVAWGDKAEQRFRESVAQAGDFKEGLGRYAALEARDFNTPIERGPFTSVLEKISRLNERFDRDEAPFQISLLTARGGKASTRALTTLKDHDIALNGFAEFKAGATKADGLRAHDPDVYFDDQAGHLSEGRICPAGLVFYVSDSPLHPQAAVSAGAGASRALPVPLMPWQRTGGRGMAAGMTHSHIAGKAQ
ncbi:MAG: 5'-nucleotidase [Micavibrio aeruginosavorus]|uniref:5'-nucleotidase n=1 Tax=Micavibrio aeruginosavorus TaxID=349221 RepID=A0A7T5R1W7_9BACT|nr:MAG: 5'-nucleotidase [Micavibrio aeruginosavorus]